MAKEFVEVNKAKMWQDRITWIPADQLAPEEDIKGLSEWLLTVVVNTNTGEMSMLVTRYMINAKEWELTRHPSHSFDTKEIRKLVVTHWGIIEGMPINIEE